MEENGRVIVRKVERPDGMTEHSLEYLPPIMISDGKYMKEEHLNMTTYTKPCNDIEQRFNETVKLMVEEIRCFRYIQSVKKDFSFLSLNKDVDIFGYFESHGALLCGRQDIQGILQQLVQIRRCLRCLHDGIQGVSSEVNESRWQPSLCPKHSLRLSQEHQEAIANRLR